MSILSRLFTRQSGRDALVPLYSSIVEAARDPAWYLDGGVADTVDGRFDMVAALVSLTLVRLEREGKSGADQSVLLTEIFIDDMDGQLRQIGVGDVVVGKHIGKMMSALGGRLSTYRGAIAGNESWEEALARNLYRGNPPAPPALAFSAARMRALVSELDALDAAVLVADGFPKP